MGLDELGAFSIHTRSPAVCGADTHQ